MRRFPPWIFAAAAALLVLAWQSITVAANYGGNWSALFCTGELQSHPPALDSEHTYFFAGFGYDGQFYHYMAHDPLLRTEISASIDSPDCATAASWSPRWLTPWPSAAPNGSTAPTASSSCWRWPSVSIAPAATAASPASRLPGACCFSSSPPSPSPWTA